MMDEINFIRQQFLKSKGLELRFRKNNELYLNLSAVQWTKLINNA